MRRLALHWQILIALGLAVIAGLLSGKTAGLFGITFYQAYDFIGTLFLNALKMIIVPLIVSSIIVGVAGVGGTHGLGRLGGKTLLYYLTTSLLAILVGLALVNLLSPGIIDGEPAKAILGLSEDAAAEAAGEPVARKGGVPHKELFGKYEEINRRTPDISKAKGILDWEPTVDLEDGLTRTLEWRKKDLSTSST